MVIIEKTVDFQLQQYTAVALGKFDGVHIGHRFLLAELLKKKAEGLQTCVFTFDPPPAVLFGFSDGKELSTKSEKRKLFDEMGVDVLIEFPLTERTADIEAEQFVREYLCGKMRARYLAAGEDLSFGRGGKGNSQLLQALQEECGYEMKLIPKICLDGEEVSSTQIRGLVEKGDMERAARMLGAPYKICGQVVVGNRIGRTIGFPTMNLLPPGDKLLPPNGVYKSRVSFRPAPRQDGTTVDDQAKQDGEDRKVYQALSNVGCKPTVTEQKIMGVESYLYDFDQELYGQEIEVELLSFCRPERRFESLEALKAQIQRDIADNF